MKKQIWYSSLWSSLPYVEDTSDFGTTDDADKVALRDVFWGLSH